MQAYSRQIESVNRRKVFRRLKVSPKQKGKKDDPTPNPFPDTYIIAMLKNTHPNLYLLGSETGTRNPSDDERERMYAVRREVEQRQLTMALAAIKHRHQILETLVIIDTEEVKPRILNEFLEGQKRSTSIDLVNCRNFNLSNLHTFSATRDTRISCVASLPWSRQGGNNQIPLIAVFPELLHLFSARNWAPTKIYIIPLVSLVICFPYVQCSVSR